MRENGGLFDVTFKWEMAISGFIQQFGRKIGAHMNNDDLINFNPILAKALAEAESAGRAGFLRQILPVLVKTRSA
jgi:hypothetical protein